MYWKLSSINQWQCILWHHYLRGAAPLSTAPRPSARPPRASSLRTSGSVTAEYARTLTLPNSTPGRRLSARVVHPYRWLGTCGPARVLLLPDSRLCAGDKAGSCILCAGDKAGSEVVSLRLAPATSRPRRRRHGRQCDNLHAQHLRHVLDADLCRRWRALRQQEDECVAPPPGPAAA